MFDVFEYGIVGMGPAGIGMAMSLKGTEKIKNAVCFERGGYTDNIDCPALEYNKCCNSRSCSIISGVGGASNFSSGKISDFPAGSGLSFFFDSEQQLRKYFRETISFFDSSFGLRKFIVDPEVKKNAELFYEQKNIKYKYYDVYEFDAKRYQWFIYKTIQELKEEGLQLFDNTEVVNIYRDPQTLIFCLEVERLNIKKIFWVRNLVLATGALNIQDGLIAKMADIGIDSYEIGIRVEIPTRILNKVLKTHGDLKLKTDTARTYCVTVDGKIIAYQTGGLHFLEGCLEPSARTNYTNLAVLVKYNNAQAVLDFMCKYRDKYHGIPIKQKFVDYIKCQISIDQVNTTMNPAIPGDINSLLPIDINESIKVFMKNVLVKTMEIPENVIILVAPELKILRNMRLDKNFEIDDNLFIIGAATGKFRGIQQSFCSGLRCGKILIRR